MNWYTEADRKNALAKAKRRNEIRRDFERRERLLRRVDFWGAVAIAVLAGYVIRLLVS